LTTDTTTRHTRAHELLDLLLGADTAPVSDLDAMTDEELLRSPIGTRVREILFRQLAVQGKEFYDKAQRKGSGAGAYGGVLLARDWVYPEYNQDGFRDASEWDEPYTPTDADQAELLRRIQERGGVQHHEEAERIAMDIADEQSK
jgi:hypothetical protein